MGVLVSSLLFQPPPPTYLCPSRYFYLISKSSPPEKPDSRMIPAFYIDCGAAITVLFSHGNAEDLGMIYDWFVSLAHSLKVNVLAYDYSGYGKSKSSSDERNTVLTSEEKCYDDILAAYTYLTETLETPPEKIVLYGRSLGSGPSIWLAAKTAVAGRSVAGVILQSPLLSAFRVAFNFRYTLPGDKFNNIDRVHLVRCPVFLIHGGCDEVVPFWHGQELWWGVESVWRAKPFWIKTAGHNNIESTLHDSGLFVKKILEFLDVHIPARWGLQSPPLTVPKCVERLSKM